MFCDLYKKQAELTFRFVFLPVSKSSRLFSSANYVNSIIKMVEISLQVSATLDHVEEIHTNHPDYTFLLKVKCLNCGECTDKWHDVIESKGYPLKNGKATVHFLAKCKLCGNENSLSILGGSNANYHNQDQGNFKSIVSFKCKGMEPVEFAPAIGWIVKVSNSGTIVEDVDLSEHEWVHYDDTINKCVGIYDFKSRFVNLKQWSKN